MNNENKVETELKYTDCFNNEIPPPPPIDYKDKYLRTLAELENVRKRQKKELQDTTQAGVEKTLKGLLPVFDSASMALASTNEKITVESVAEGFNIILNQFDKALTKLGVERIETVGIKFNPAVHEAINQMESDLPSGHVALELQAGWMLGDFVIRAALVAVSKGV